MDYLVNQDGIIKTAVGNNNFLSSQQVKELLFGLSFENNKLEMAKYCYRFASDAQSYYVVADVLQYSSSRNELLRYIQQNKQTDLNRQQHIIPVN